MSTMDFQELGTSNGRSRRIVPIRCRFNTRLVSNLIVRRIDKDSALF